jgi:DNA-binding MarR family transcriptional regulator
MYAEPGYLIRRLHQRSTAQFAAATHGLDITQIQFAILLVIEDRPGIDATRISELIGSDRTTIRQALLILEKKALIRRATGTHDRRTKTLEITPAGAAMVGRISDRVANLGRAILHGLNAQEYAVFSRLLTKLVAEQEGNEAVGEDAA